MHLSNQNFSGHVPKEVYECKIHFLEMAIITPAWTNMIAYYIEGDHGHQYLFNCLGKTYQVKRFFKILSHTNTQLPYEKIPTTAQ